MTLTIDGRGAPTDIDVRAMPLTTEQRAWVELANSQLNLDQIRQFNVDITSIHSPTGMEREACTWLVDYMSGLGMEARYQGVDETSGNAIGFARGTGKGPSLMLYAPIDTHLAADPAIDLPWAGRELRPDMLPVGHVDERTGNVVGLGAANPKGMVTAVMAAVEAVVRAGVPLQGDVLAAFCGGGMPMHAPPSYPRKDLGLGSGVFFMVQQGVTADYGIIVKPGYAVYWEEPGLAWFRVTTRGNLGYAGFPHDMPGYRNAIADLARVIVELEEWLPRYAERNASGLVSPQGALGALRAGFPYKPSLPPAAAEAYLDIRINPRSTALEVKRQLEEELDEIRGRHPEIEVDCELIAAYASASTDPNNWIVQSATRGWEHVEGRPHDPPRRMSGQTDASMLRNLGIPMARVGMPSPVPGTPPEWSAGLGGMGVSHVPDLERLARVLIYTIIDTCTRTTEEVAR